MTQALDAAALAAEAYAANQESNPGGADQYWPELSEHVLRAALPAEPGEEELGLMWNAYRWACRTGCNPMAAAYRALRAHLLGGDA